MAKIDDCIKNLRDKGIGADLSDAELRAIAEDISSFIAKPDAKTRLKRYIDKKHKDLDTQELAKLYNKSVDSLNEGKLNDSKFKENPVRFFKDQLINLNKKIQFITNRNKHGLFYSLEKNGINEDEFMDRIRDDSFTPDILKGIEALNKNDMKSFEAFDPKIQGIAKSIRETLGIWSKNLTDQGIPFVTRMDYLIRQTHSITKMSEGADSKNKWVSFIKEKLDLSKTFEDISDDLKIDQALSEIYDDIIESTYSGISVGNVNSRRSLHFKNAENFADYHVNYGRGNILEIMNETANAISKYEAFASEFGTMPKKGYEAFKMKAMNSLSAKQRSELKDGFILSSMEKQIFGYGTSESQHWVGRVADNLKTWNIITKLSPASYFSTFTDAAINAYNFSAKTGVPFIESFIKQTKVWTNNLKEADRKRFAKLYGIASDTELSAMVGADPRGSLSRTKFVKKMMEWNLLNYSTKVNRGTATQLWLNHLTDLKDVHFENLDPRLKKSFDKFGISEKDFKEILKGIDETDPDVKIISFDKMNEMKVKRDAQTKFGTWLTHESEFGAVSADLETRAIMSMGTDPNSVPGKVLSSIMLFKSYSLRMGSAIGEIIKSNPNADNRTILKALSNVDNLSLFGQFTASAMLASVAGMTARDLFNNKGFRDWTKKDNLVEAATRSVMPLQVEFISKALSGEYDKFGRSVLLDLAGPVGQNIGDIFGLTSTAVEDFENEARSGIQSKRKFVNLLKSNIPGNNTPFLKPLLDHAALKAIYWDDYDKEVRRKNRNLKKRTGQEPIF